MESVSDTEDGEGKMDSVGKLKSVVSNSVGNKDKSVGRAVVIGLGLVQAGCYSVSTGATSQFKAL